MLLAKSNLRRERLAHSLKGVAANVGSNAVADAASELEQVLRREEGPDVAIGAVDKALRPVMNALADQMHIDTTMTTPPIDAPAEVLDLAEIALPPWVDDLRQLLADGDVAPTAVPAWRRLKAFYR